MKTATATIAHTTTNPSTTTRRPFLLALETKAVDRVELIAQPNPHYLHCPVCAQQYRHGLPPVPFPRAFRAQPRHCGMCQMAYHGAHLHQRTHHRWLHQWAPSDGDKHGANNDDDNNNNNNNDDSKDDSVPAMDTHGATTCATTTAPIPWIFDESCTAGAASADEQLHRYLDAAMDRCLLGSGGHQVHRHQQAHHHHHHHVQQQQQQQQQHEEEETSTRRAREANALQHGHWLAFCKAKHARRYHGRGGVGGVGGVGSGAHVDVGVGV